MYKASININQTVRVKLTGRGRKIMQNHAWQNKPEDSLGWSEWQLWELMQLFGGYIGLGKTLPFETDIEMVIEG